MSRITAEVLQWAKDNLDKFKTDRNLVSWLTGKHLVLCPLSGLGFLRISSNRKAFNYAMEQARRGLREFCNERRVEWISDDLAPLDSKPKVSEEVTDTYLADVAAKHGFKFGILDGGIKHPTAELIA